MNHGSSVSLRMAALAIAAAVVCVWSGQPAAPAWGAATVGFSPAGAVVQCDDTVDVDVTIDGSVTDLRGFTFVFEFDPSVVSPVAVSAGPLVTGAACPYFFTWLNSGAVGDSIAVDGANLGCSMAGPGTIVRISFVGTGFGTGALSCRSGSLRDSQNAAILFDCVPGTIEHACVTPVESKSWGRIKTLFR